MKTRGDVAYIIAALVIMLVSPHHLTAELPELSRVPISGVLFPEEDQEAIWSYNTDDAEVKLFMTGSWRSTSGFGFGFRRQPLEHGQEFLWGTRLPGFSPSPLLSEVETISTVWIDNQYFISTEIVNDMETRNLLMGYRGKQTELLQSLVFGYGLFPFPSYPGIQGTPGEDPVPGLQLHVKNNGLEHHTDITMNQGDWEEKYYSSHGEIHPESLKLSRPLEPVEFVLPDAGINTEHLMVWIQDNDGQLTSNGMQFRAAIEGKDYYYRQTNNTIEILKNSGFLVHYTHKNANIGDSQLGNDAVIDLRIPSWPQSNYSEIPPTIDFAWDSLEWLSYLHDAGMNETQFRWEIDGYDALLIHFPGRFSPFGRYNRYDGSAIGEVDDLAAILLTPGETPNQIRAHLEDDTVVIRWNGIDSMHPAWRYPVFWFPDAYFHAKAGFTPTVTFLSHAHSDAEQEIQLDDTVVPASLQVFRNGRQTDSFTYNESTGVLHIFPRLQPSEILYIRYHRAVSSGDPMIQLRSGTRGEFRDGIHWSFSQLGYWGIDTDRTKNTPPRTIQLQTAVEQMNDTYQWNIAGGLNYGSVSANRNQTLFAWGDTRSISFSAQGIRPASPPETIRLSTRSDTITGLAHSARGELRYRGMPVLMGDYVKYPYINPQSIALSADYSAPDGGYAGPYLGRVSRETTVPAVFMDFAIAENKGWVGTQFMTQETGFFDDAEKLDIRFFLRLSEKVPEARSPVRVILQFGNLSEDLDDNRSISQSTLGIPFFTDDGRELLVSHHGALANQASMAGPLSEDWSDSGELNRGLLPAHWSDELSVDITDKLLPATGKYTTDWKNITIELGHLSAEARRQLSQANGVRIIVLQPDDTESIAGIMGVQDWRITTSNSQKHSDIITTSIENGVLRILSQRGAAGLPCIIEGPVHSSFNSIGNEVELTIEGDPYQDVTINIQFIRQDGSTNQHHFTVVQGSETNIRLDLGGSAHTVTAYRIEVIPETSNPFNIGISAPTLSGSDTDLQSSLSGLFQWSDPELRIARFIHAPYARIFADQYVSQENYRHTAGFSAGSGIADLYVEGSAELYNTSSNSILPSKLSHTIAYPFQNVNSRFSLPAIGSNSAIDLSATGIFEDDSGIYILDHYLITGTSHSSRRRISSVWMQYVHRPHAFSVFAGGDGHLGTQEMFQTWQGSMRYGYKQQSAVHLDTQWRLLSRRPLLSVEKGVLGNYQYHSDHILLQPGYHPADRREIKHTARLILGSSAGSQILTNIQLNSQRDGITESSGTDSSKLSTMVQASTKPLFTANVRFNYEFSRSLHGTREHYGVTSASDYTAFIGDTYTAYELLHPYISYHFAVPGTEIRADAIPPIDRADDYNTVGVIYTQAAGFERELLTGIHDLWIPQSASLSFRRQLSSSIQQNRNSITTSLQLRYRALNLFGQFGSNTISHRYDFDDYIGSILLKHVYPENVFSISPRIHAQFSRDSVLKILSSSEWEYSLNALTGVHTHRSTTAMNFLAKQTITTAWELMETLSLTQGPGIELQHKKQINGISHTIMTSYEIVFEYESSINFGGDITIGVSRLSHDELSSASYDTGITAKLFAAISW